MSRFLSTRWKPLLLALLAFLPAIYTARLVARLAVDVGCWDMWENGELLGKYHEGKLTWHDLYAPQIQHRIVFPRLIIIALTHLSGGDFRWENYVTFGLVLLSAVLLHRLMRRTLGDGLWVTALSFVANLLIFSPMLYQIFFWGSSMWMCIPMPCLLGILNLASPGPSGTLTRPWARFAAILALAEVATHSFSHGLAFWPVIIAYLLLQPAFADKKARLLMTGITAIIAAVTITCYFTDFRNVAFHAYNLARGDYAMEGGLNLLNAAERSKFYGFFFGFLGNPFARSPFEDHPLLQAEDMGVWVLAAFLVVAALTAFTRTGRRLWIKALPWLGLCAYVIGVALAISKGRAHIGEHRSVTTRYIVISLFLPVGTLALWYLYVRAWLAEKRATGGCCAALASSRAPSMIAACGLTAFAVMQLPQWSYGLHLTNVWHHARRQAQALVFFLPHIKPASMKVLDKDYRYCLEQIRTLAGLGLLKTKPLESADLKWFRKDTKALPENQATLTEATYLPNGALRLRGNARFGQGKPADAVLVTVGDKVIALGQPKPKPTLRIYALDYEFANVDELPVNAMYPWEAEIPASVLPAERSELSLWALEVATRKVNRVTRHPSIDPTTKTAEIR